MYNPKKHGKPPYKVIVIHGGPGSPGEMATVAKELSVKFGVLEPLQTKSSVNEQIRELHSLIKYSSETPVKLIGHSWGAWLAYMFTSEYPSIVEKLILIGAGAFEEQYTLDITGIRMDRLSVKDRQTIQKLLVLLNSPRESLLNEPYDQLIKLMIKADSYELLPLKNETFEFQYEIFRSVWTEAEEMRKSGELLKYAEKISCPVTAIHGDYDPHSWKGVKEPLSRILSDFKFIKLEKCGHYPWYENLAKDKFYDVLIRELK